MSDSKSAPPFVLPWEREAFRKLAEASSCTEHQPVEVRLSPRANAIDVWAVKAATPRDWRAVLITTGDNKADAAFYGQARTIVLALLDEVDRLERELEGAGRFPFTEAPER